jgi:hypothetical protein
MAVVVTWNVAGRVRSVPDQAGALAARPADLVTLQEVRASALLAWTAALREMGFGDVRPAPLEDPRRADRRLAVLVAARDQELQVLPSPPLPWPERHLAVLAHLDGQPVEVHALHAPISSKPDQVKVRTPESIAAVLAPPRPVPTLLAGYEHAWREAGLSDHSGLWVALRAPGYRLPAADAEDRQGAPTTSNRPP